MSQVFDINSYIASLKGTLLTIQNQINSTTQEQQTAQQNAISTNNQLQTLTHQYYSTSLGEQGVSQDQLNTLHNLGNQLNTYNSTASNDTSLLSNLQKQASALQDQITAATQQATVPRTLSITDTIGSSPSTGLKLPSLSQISPTVLLIAAGIGLIILLK